MRQRTGADGDRVALCDGAAENYLALIAAVFRLARADAKWDDRAYAWLRHSGVRWAGALGIEHPECVAEGIR